MFFEKTETISIDGQFFEISPAARFETYNSKVAMVEIFNFCDPDTMQHVCTFDTYTGWKKDLTKLLKEFDKYYVKHSSNKGTFAEINNIHESTMKPLMDLILANSNFHKLENMIKAKMEVPEFRHEALEDEFCKYMTGICDLFKTYGTLVDHYDMKQMISTLKIDNWSKCIPFEFYLTPMKQKIKLVRDTMLNMEKLGHLKIRYIIEDNTEL